MYLCICLNVLECGYVCDGRDQSGRLLWVLKLSGLSNVLTKDLGEEEPKGHRDKMPCPGRKLPHSCLSLAACADTQPVSGSHLPFSTRATCDLSSIKDAVCSTLWFPHSRA